jgi:hypothetical protein
LRAISAAGAVRGQATLGPARLPRPEPGNPPATSFGRVLAPLAGPADHRLFAALERFDGTLIGLNSSIAPSSC